jgi:hypothetical protein
MAAIFLRDMLALLRNAPAAEADAANAVREIRGQVTDLKRDAQRRIDFARHSHVPAAEQDFALLSTAHALLESIELYEFSALVGATDDLPSLVRLIDLQVSQLARYADAPRPDDK